MCCVCEKTCLFVCLFVLAIRWHNFKIIYKNSSFLLDENKKMTRQASVEN